MLPLLNYIRDGHIHHTQDTVNHLAKEFNLSEEELNEWLPSKKQKTFHNRVHWAKSHLKMAGIIDNVGRGVFKITERGQKLLQQSPGSVNVKYLTEQFSDYNALINGFRKKESKTEVPTLQITPDEDLRATPEEQIESGYQKIRKSLEQEVLLKLKSIQPFRFEEVVVQLLVKMGYGGSIAEAGKATKYTNDEGIDGIIKEDKLGLDVIYIQAKRWEGTVSRPEIQKFVGALAGQRAKKGVFITTSSFSKEAITYASQMDTKIVLIDGEQLAQYMIDYNLGVSVQNIYEIKKIDFDYFDEE